MENKFPCVNCGKEILRKSKIHKYCSVCNGLVQRIRSKEKTAAKKLQKEKTT